MDDSRLPPTLGDDGVPQRPTAARMYDDRLGGFHSTAADRQGLTTLAAGGASPAAPDDSCFDRHWLLEIWLTRLRWAGVPSPCCSPSSSQSSRQRRSRPSPQGSPLAMACSSGYCGASRVCGGCGWRAGWRRGWRSDSGCCSSWPRRWVMGLGDRSRCWAATKGSGRSALTAPSRVALIGPPARDIPATLLVQLNQAPLP